MESANLSHQHHQHQEQFGGSSSSIALPSLHGAADHSSSHLWNQNLTQTGSNYCSAVVNGVNFLTVSRDLSRQSHESTVLVPPSLNISLLQDQLGSQWASSTADNHSTHLPGHEVLHLSKVKAELSESSFPKYGINPSNLEEVPLPSTSYIKHEQQFLQDLNEKLLLRSFSSSSDGFQQNSTELMYTPSSKSSYTSSLGNVINPSTRGGFSRIHPSATISGLNNPLSSVPFLGNSLGLNLQAMDLLASAKLGGCFTQPSISNLGLLKESCMPFGFDNIRSDQPNQDQSSNCNSQKISFVHGAADSTKRPNGLSDYKASQSAPKKPRFESRSSFPPFKVRKEKLGDRIAALQQLVAPFGKTDTASVLMEAIGYIKFLQDQVETLSVPYMKSSGKTKRGSSLQGGITGDEEGEEEPKRDLRSRGLCLVPLSCTSYVTNDSGSVWSPPPNFTGGN